MEDKLKKEKRSNENPNSGNENNRNSSNAQQKRCRIAGGGRDLGGEKGAETERKRKHVFVGEGIKTIFKTTFIHL